MVQPENHSASRSFLPTWLIFGMLGLAATLCGLILPQGLRSLQDVAAALPAFQTPSQPSGTGGSPVSGTGISPVSGTGGSPVTGTGISPVGTHRTGETPLLPILAGGTGVSPVGTQRPGETPVPPANVGGTGTSPGQTKQTLEYEPPTLPEMPELGPMFLRLTLGTIFVLILCIMTLWAVKRWVKPSAAPISESRKLRVLESLPLGGRCSVFLLQAEEAKILVGVDQAGIKTLMPLPQPFDAALTQEESQLAPENMETPEKRQKERHKSVNYQNN